MRLQTCTMCDDEFDLHSPAKRKAGGLAIHCPECSEESTPKALGFASGDGKMASISIVKCETQQDADKLKAYWRLASGMNKGKECQMNNSATMPGVRFLTVTKSGSMNHKGKA